LRVPFDDLELQYSELADDIMVATERVWRSGRYVFTQGSEVAEFERAFAEYCGSEHCIGTSSGTAALHLALVAAKIGPGDEVLIPANTYAATVFACSYVGAQPVLVDIDPVTYNIDVEQAAQRISSRTRAIMPVHLYGHPADMDSIMSLAEQHQLTVIEDAAQAHGASYRGRRTGTWGHAAAFSFYPTKNLGAFGDAGAVTTNDEVVAASVRQMRYMGQQVKYHHDAIGFQERMDEIQAAVLTVKLRRLERWNEQRRQQASCYNSLLEDLPIVTPTELPECHHVYYVYTVRAHDRDALMQWLTERGVSTGIFYPIPIPLQRAYAELGHRSGDFPETERAAAETFALPVFPGYPRDAIEYVAEQVRAFYHSSRRETVASLVNPASAD